jgi:hypothetical protein
MTEEEWLACENVRDMLQFLRYSVLWPATESRGRKYRLFACACVRMYWDLDERSRSAVAVAERLADGQVSREELAEARSAGAVGAARKTLLRSPRMAATDVSYGLLDPNVPRLLRCIVGNPFRPSSVDPAIATPTVISLARAAYDERLLPGGELEGGRLAVLSDALEEAGCYDADILDHLRGPGLHTRGCWVVDLLLDLT